MSDCNHQCGSCKENCDSRTEPESFKAEANAASHIKKIIGVASGKGGVGKSMVTSLLAIAMNQLGYKTAILDGDITGPSIGKIFHIEGKAVGNQFGMIPMTSQNGIKIMSINSLLDSDTSPVIWRGPIVASMVKQFYTDVAWGEVDYMFVDMPPGTGDVPLTLYQSLPLDGIVLVTTPQDLVSMIVSKAINMAKMMDIPLVGLIENMSYLACPDCDKKINIFGESKAEALAQEFKIPLLAKMPLNPQWTQLADEGRLEEADPKELFEMVIQDIESL